MSPNNFVYATDIRYYSIFKGKYGESSIAEIISILSKYSVNITGENIVLSGYTVDTEIDGRDIIFKVNPGWVIQDEMLINQRSSVQLRIENVAHLNKNGLLTINLRFNTYLTKREFTYDDSQIRFNHINTQGNAYYSWDHERDSVLLNIYNFDYDSDGNITHLQESSMRTLVIESKSYVVGGYALKNFHLSRYLDEYLKLKGYSPGGGGEIPEGQLTEFDYTQSVASNEWQINHNLGRRPFFVKTYNILDVEIEGFVDYQHQTDNSITIYFSELINGFAKLFFN
jgi:hypothetical protein